MIFPTKSHSKSVKGHWGLVRLQIQLLEVGCSEGLRHRCAGHLSGKSRLSRECSSYRATCHMLWIHMFHYSPGEAFTQLQVSRLNYDILPAPCARDIRGKDTSEQIYCPVTLLLLQAGPIGIPGAQLGQMDECQIAVFFVKYFFTLESGHNVRYCPVYIHRTYIGQLSNFNI